MHQAVLQHTGVGGHPIHQQRLADRQAAPALNSDGCSWLAVLWRAASAALRCRDCASPLLVCVWVICCLWQGRAHIVSGIRTSIGSGGGCCVLQTWRLAGCRSMTWCSTCESVQRRHQVNMWLSLGCAVLQMLSLARRRRGTCCSTCGRGPSAMPLSTYCRAASRWKCGLLGSPRCALREAEASPARQITCCIRNQMACCINRPALGHVAGVPSLSPPEGGHPHQALGSGLPWVARKLDRSCRLLFLAHFFRITLSLRKAPA